MPPRCPGYVGRVTLLAGGRAEIDKRTKTKSAEGRSLPVRCMVACGGMLIITGVKLKPKALLGPGRSQKRSSSLMAPYVRPPSLAAFHACSCHACQQ